MNMKRNTKVFGHISYPNRKRTREKNERERDNQFTYYDAKYERERKKSQYARGKKKKKAFFEIMKFYQQYLLITDDENRMRERLFDSFLCAFSFDVHCCWCCICNCSCFLIIRSLTTTNTFDFCSMIFKP